MKRAPKRERQGIGAVLAAHMQEFWRELVGTALIISGIVALVALYSFYPFDTTLFYVRSFSEPIHNWCGVVGAHLAAYLLYWCGGAAYGVVGIVLFVGGLLVVRGEWHRYVMPILFSGIGITAFAGILRGHPYDVSAIPPGGLLGKVVYATTQAHLGHIGALIVLYGVVWLSIIGMLRISFVHVGVLVSRAAYYVSMFVGRGIMQGAQGVCALVAPIVSQWWTKRRSPHIMIEDQQDARHEEVDFWRTLEDNVVEDDDVNAACEQDNADDMYDEYDEYDGDDEPRQIAARVIDVFSSGVMWLRNTVIDASIRQAMSTHGSSAGVEISYTLPDASFFEQPMSSSSDVSRSQAEKMCRARAAMLQEKLKHFGIYGEVTAIRPGPVVTLFEYTPEIGTKISKIIALEDDLALALKAHSIRIIAPIPGKSVVGFEISNEERRSVRLAEIVSHDVFTNSTAALPLALGVDLVGDPVVDDLLSMPHLLVAGSTGSGKSVGLNSMLMSLLLTRRPDELKLILVDPKRLEFSLYDSIPHLLFPIVTDPRKVPNILRWVVQEMERRYEIMAHAGVRNMVDFNRWARRHKQQETLPYLVLVIDELADVMMVAGKEVEHHVTRIAQMARAAGIHMIIATQRPSVDVVTGLIKVNFPSRVSFRVSSKVDSKTILDMAGAEKLLGRGDMLYTDPRSVHLRRIHGPYVSEQEIKAVTEFLREQAQPHYEEEALAVLETNSLEEQRQTDELYTQVLDYVKSMREVSISMLQRKFRIGFNRSARLIDTLEQRGVIAPAQGAKPRKVLISS